MAAAAATWDVGRILVRVRPQLIITTGALPGLEALVLVRPLGVRTLLVGRIVNSETLSRPGRHAKRLASEVATQWPTPVEPGVDHWAMCCAHCLCRGRIDDAI